MSVIREATARFLPQIAAIQRVRLRQWLRRNVEHDDQPDHIYLGLTIAELRQAIIDVGGDDVAIFEEVTNGAIERVKERMLL